jgi:hypothetical protein
MNAKVATTEEIKVSLDQLYNEISNMYCEDLVHDIVELEIELERRCNK